MSLVQRQKDIMLSVFPLLYLLVALEDLGWENIHQIENITLKASDINNKYIFLAQEPMDKDTIIVQVKGGPIQHQGTDFIIVNGTNNKKISWDGYLLENSLAVGDILVIEYYIERVAASSSSS